MIILLASVFKGPIENVKTHIVNKLVYYVIVRTIQGLVRNDCVKNGLKHSHPSPTCMCKNQNKVFCIYVAYIKLSKV